LPVTLPAQKIFKPKFPQLPEVADYRCISEEDFYSVFPVNLVQPTKSNIDADQLEQCLVAAEVNITPQIEKVLGWIRYGAEIGCRGK
jgi:hypothetical protein